MQARDLFDKMVLPAVRRGAKLRWAYSRLPGRNEIETGNTTLFDWHVSQDTYVIQKEKDFGKFVSSEEVLDELQANLRALREENL